MGEMNVNNNLHDSNLCAVFEPNVNFNISVPSN